MTQVQKIETESRPAEGRELRTVERAAPSRALSPFDEMDRLFDSLFGGGWLRPWRWESPSWSGMMASLTANYPRLDIIDRDEDILVRAEVPGVSKDNLEVSLTDNTLTISGTTYEEKENEGNYYRQEIARGSFSRSITLPVDVDADHVSAHFRDGILELTLPKVEKARRRTIKVE